MIAPNGIATRQVGRIDTLATNHSWWTNSRHWTGLRKAARTVSSDIAAKLPASRKTHPAGVVMGLEIPLLGTVCSGQPGTHRVKGDHQTRCRCLPNTVLKPRQGGPAARARRSLTGSVSSAAWLRPADAER